MLFSAIFLAAGLLIAETPDTLREVRIVADRGVVVSRTDTVKSITNVPTLGLSDYGGAAALKSVSMRGLGSAHTAIYLDGIRMNNIMTGQIDLGLIDMQTIDGMVVDYAQNSLSFTTARPYFGPSESRDGKNEFRDRVRGRLHYGIGSFGSHTPSGSISYKISDRLAVSANASAVISQGDFAYGDGLLRKNNDICQIRGGADLFGTMNDGKWQAKLFVNSVNRGNPGSISWPSESDRQNDRNFLIQAGAEQKFSAVYSAMVNAKLSSDKLDYLSKWGDSSYNLKEAQLNSTHRFRLAPWAQLSFAADFQWDGLKSNQYDGQRFGTTAVLGAALRFRRLSVDAALDYSGKFDSGTGAGETGGTSGTGADASSASFNNVSPSIDLRYALTRELVLGAFARRAFRAPTFNELYYPGFGNAELRPEDAFLSDVGLDWHKDCSGGLSLTAKLDGFYNVLRDKIIAYPSPQAPSIWLPYNVGLVKAAGVDFCAGADYRSGDWHLAMQARYSFQDARDKTEGSLSYGSQIAFIARHSCNLSAATEYKGFRFDACWNLRSGRFDSEGEMPAWNTLDLGLRKSLNISGVAGKRAGRSSDGPRTLLTLGLSVHNILDCRYEFVRGYPMPPRSLMAEISINF